MVRMTSSIAQDRKKAVLEKKKTTSSTLLIPTGSTLLNLACSDCWYGGFAAGSIVNIVGDRSAGKTLLSLTMMACTIQDKRFSEYKFIYDDVERKSHFNIESLFGKKAAQQIISPQVKDNEPVYSETMEEMWGNLGLWLKKKIPFIYVVDSFDSLATEEDFEQEEQMEALAEKGTKIKGGYRLGKTKLLSSTLRKTKSELSKTNSLLVIVSQVRANLDPMSFEKKTRAGGYSLGHSCTHEIWLAISGKIKHPDRKDKVIGHEISAKVTKNHLTGKVRNIEFSTLNDYGVDDIHSCIEFMTKEKFWEMNGAYVIPEDLYEGQKFYKKNLIETIESNRDEEKLSRLVGVSWNELEEEIRTKRRNRFS